VLREIATGVKQRLGLEPWGWLEIRYGGLDATLSLRIQNGAWCLWRANPGGTRQGKVVLAQHRDIDDPELGGGYTVKVYESEKVATDDGGWRHAVVRLKPDSDDPTFEPIVLEDLQEGELSIVAELVEVVS